ncbi:MAG: hypothetical protein V4473_00570 [Patescibacteria group bacterium]
MSLFSIFDDTHEEVSLMIDIGNGSIALAFVLFRPESNPYVLYTNRLPFVMSEKLDEAQLLSGTCTLLTDLLKEAMLRGFEDPYWKGKKKHLRNALLAFSSPWYVSKTKHIHLTQENAFIITEKFIVDVIEEESKMFQQEMRATEYGGAFNGQLEVVEKAIVHSKINGYAIRDVIGKKTKVFDAYVCLSVVAKVISDKITDIIFSNSHIPKDHMIVHTFPVVSFGTIKEIFVNETDFLIMDVAGEATDITLVQNDVIVQTATFPSGRNFVIRQIAKALGVSPEIAESMFHLWSSRKGDDEVEQDMQKILDDIEREWAIYLENALLELSPKMSLPSKVYITADDDVAQLYTEFLKFPKNDTTSLFRYHANIMHLNTEMLSQMFKNNPRVQSDEFIGILAVFYNKIRKQ